jgi:hypothetical protein
MITDQQQSKNKPSVEHLEERQLLAAAVALNAAGVLNIKGTRGADRVEVSASGDVVNVRLGARHYTFTASQINAIVARLGQGNDRFINSTSIRCSVFGDGGHDRIIGGTSADVLDGGHGNDRMRGGDGDDMIRGGPGQTSRNVMFGEGGIDSFLSRSKRDIIDPGDQGNGSAGLGGLNAGAQLILNQMNAARAARGLAPLQVNSTLQAIAQQHANNMAQLDRYGDDDNNGHYLFGKDFVVRAHEGGYTVYLDLGENVAYNYGYSNPAQQLFNQWWNSPGHRDNMLYANFTEVGIGVATSASGRTYGVQMFGRPG